MNATDYEKYLVRKPLYEAFGGVKNRQSPAMTFMSNKQVPGANHYIEIGWVHGIPEPNPGLAEHVHDHDEIVFYWGGNHESPQVLGAEIEFYVGGQPVTFNTTTAIYIPAGTPHAPVTWKKFTSPHIQMAMMLGSGSAPTAWHDGVSKKIEKKPMEKRKAFDYEGYVVRSPMREAGAEFVRGRTSPTMTYMSGVQIPGVKYYIEMGWTFDMPLSRNPDSAMPEMVHKNFDEIVLHIGGDPAAPEDLGADLEFYVGGQSLAFNTSSALFIPRGLHHGPIFCRQYRKPHIVMAIMCGAGTVKEGWSDSFITRPGKEFKK
ncbi:MAG: hypothetical protein A2Z29_05745 [Chloroflexi bacterium RBG_16_56_11]|nr:MAG: hypothetical protein A2Z29_05745 [Chloroflexi bacterium RBG_16_56_11]